jgi:hypothetical protein
MTSSCEIRCVKVKSICNSGMEMPTTVVVGRMEGWAEGCWVVGRNVGATLILGVSESARDGANDGTADGTFVVVGSKEGAGVGVREYEGDVVIVGEVVAVVSRVSRSLPAWTNSNMSCIIDSKNKNPGPACRKLNGWSNLIAARDTACTDELDFYCLSKLFTLAFLYCLC